MSQSSGSARRCSTCGIDYPTTIMKCQVCGESNDFCSGVTPDADWEHSVALARAPHRSRDEKVTAWRELRLLDMGFDGREAAEAATWRHADLYRMKEMLDAGATRFQVLTLHAPLDIPPSRLEPFRLASAEAARELASVPVAERPARFDA